MVGFRLQVTAASLGLKVIAKIDRRPVELWKQVVPYFVERVLAAADVLLDHVQAGAIPGVKICERRLNQPSGTGHSLVTYRRKSSSTNCLASAIRLCSRIRIMHCSRETLTPVRSLPLLQFVHRIPFSIRVILTNAAI